MTTENVSQNDRAGLYCLGLMEEAQVQRVSGLVKVLQSISHSKNGKTITYLTIREDDFFGLLFRAKDWVESKDHKGNDKSWGAGFVAYHSKRDDLSKELPEEIYKEFQAYIHSVDSSMDSSAIREAVSSDGPVLAK